MEIIALGALEFSSIAIGILALDEMVKIAPVKIIEARTMCPGKYLIVFNYIKLDSHYFSFIL